MKKDWPGIAILSLLSALIILCLFAWTWKRGAHYGACTERCRPAAFDSDQHVNGGCLCIGSDKVLRIKEAP